MGQAYFPDTVWRAVDPETVGIDPCKIIELDSVVEKRHAAVNGILVLKSGYIALETYRNGYGPNDTHHLASVTKSVLSALIGIAIEKRYIQSVDQSILDFFPEYDGDSSDGIKAHITIRHLLTMTTPYTFEDWREPIDTMCRQEDWSRYALDMIGGGVIGPFKYSTAGAHLLSVILSRASGKSARAFANEYLFTSIGMQEILDNETQGFEFDDLFGTRVTGWVKDPGNHSAGGWGLTASLRDMGRFGMLYTRGGTWETEAVIPRSWIHESTAPHTEVIIDGSRAAYGYLWWIHNDEVKAHLAMGDGGTVLCCIPENDTVIAIVSKVANPRNDVWRFIARYIMPAVVT